MERSDPARSWQISSCSGPRVALCILAPSSQGLGATLAEQRQSNNDKMPRWWGGVHGDGSVQTDIVRLFSREWPCIVRRTVVVVLIALLAVGGLFVASTSHSYVTTPSMWPNIPPGSLIFVRSEPSYHVGEVIEFRANGLVWAHRLIGITHAGDYVTKGDNPANVPDIFVPPVTKQDVIGAVVAAPRFLGFPILAMKHPSYALHWFVTELGTAGKLAVLMIELLLFAWLLKYRRRTDAKSAMRGIVVSPTASLDKTRS